MMLILLYSAAILIETILLVNYIRLRLVEVRLPEPCSSLNFAWFVFMVSRGGRVALTRGAAGLSAVCDCGIS